MLNGGVLDELVRPSDLREHLVEAAWPALATESRLMVIHAVVESEGGACPLWLALLALDDNSEFVRYLAARSTNFFSPYELAEGERGAIARLQFEALRVKVRCDESSLVRMAADRIDSDRFAELNRAPQLLRLISIRAFFDADVGEFMRWLSNALVAGVSDDDLASCAQEFFSLPTCLPSYEEDGGSEELRVEEREMLIRCESRWRVPAQILTQHWSERVTEYAGPRSEAAKLEAGLLASSS